jgi:hypothetical protein
MTFSKLNLALGFSLLIAVGCSTDSRRAKNIQPGDQLDYKMASGTNFRASTLSVDSTYNVAFQSNGLVSKKLYNFSVCLKDLGGAAVLPDLQFSISDGAGQTTIRPTDKSGCIQWAETFEIAGFESETLYLLKRTVAAVAVYRGEVYLEAALNPSANGGASVVDTRKTQLPERVKVVDIGPLSMKDGGVKSKTAGKDSRIQVNLESIMFQDLGLAYDKYEINRFLGLTVAHKYRVRLRPSLVRESMDTEIDTRVISKGQMKVTLTLLKDINAPGKMDAANVVTSVEFIGEVILGTVTADIVLKHDNISSLLSRSQAVVTVEPMDELANIPEATFVGISNPGPLGFIALIPAAENAKDLAQRAAELKSKDVTAREAMTPVQLMVQKNNMKPLDVTGEVGVGIAGSKKISVKDALEQMLAGKMSSDEEKYLAYGLASQIDPDGHPLMAKIAAKITGRKNPLIFEKRDLVESLNSTTPEFTGETGKESLAIITATDYSYSKGKGHSFSLNGGVSGGASVSGGAEGSLLGSKVGASLSGRANVGRDWFQVWTTSRSQVTKVGSVASRTINVVSNSFQIDANVTSCLIMGVPNTSKDVRYYYCAAEPKKQKRVETYYLLNETVGDDSTGYSDSADPKASPWRMFIRGPKSYMMFAQMVNNLKEKVLVLEKLPDTAALQATMRQFPEFYMMQEFPGMLTPQ